MAALIAWFNAGTPTHWVLLTSFLYAVLEWWLPRTSSVRARSTIELIANLLKQINVPVGKLATPPPPIPAVQAEVKEITPPPPVPEEKP